MNKGFLRTAAVLGALSVALGAFAAHKLKELVSEYAIGIFETGVRYQFYHVFALMIVGILFAYGKRSLLRWSGIFFLMGIALFSGSLYLLTWMQTAEVSAKWVGPITPLGGVCFIVGWILLFAGLSGRKTTADV